MEVDTHSIEQNFTIEFANGEVASRRRKKITDGFRRIEVVAISAVVAAWAGWIAWGLLF